MAREKCEGCGDGFEENGDGGGESGGGTGVMDSIPGSGSSDGAFRGGIVGIGGVVFCLAVKLE